MPHRISSRLSCGLVLLSLLLSLCTSLPIAAQDSGCVALVMQALERTRQHCLEIGRDAVCYGHLQVSAEPRDGTAALDFSAPGDVVNITHLKSLQVGPMDISGSTWGVAYMRIRANLPDTAAGQFVTLLMFGDTEIREASAEFSEKMDSTFAPMQAFYFRTGLGSGPLCQEFPTAGILIQTPQGAGKVELAVNGVRLTLGSTALLQNAPASPGAGVPYEMKVKMFEGEADVRAAGGRQKIGPGQQVSVPLDDRLWPTGAPSAPLHNPPDECSALSNLGAVAGKFGLIDQPAATGKLSAPPRVKISMSASISSNKPVQFSDKSVSEDPDNPIVSRLWDFGDGETSTEQDPQHRYAYGGEYTVTLTITLKDGSTATGRLPLKVPGP